jgi:hypothetical protein
MQKLFNYFNNKLNEKEDEEITRKLIEASQDHEHKKRWGQILEEKHKILPPSKNTAKKKSQKKILFKKIALAAASVLLLLFAGIAYNNILSPSVAQLDTEALVRSYLAEKYHYPNLKKGVTEEDFRAKATHAYSRMDYQEAIQYYDQIPNLEEEDFVFKGLSYLYQHQSEKAIPLLEKAIALIPFKSFRSDEEIKWHLCLAYIKNQDFEKAKIELNTLASNKKSKRQKDAQLLLKSLSSQKDKEK